MPAGTSVPQWALADVTVRFYLSFLIRANGVRQHEDLTLWDSAKAMGIGGRKP